MKPPLRFVLAAALPLILLCLWTVPGSAQITDDARAYYEDWQATASRAEEAIENARASNAALGELRADLVVAGLLGAAFGLFDGGLVQ